MNLNLPASIVYPVALLGGLAAILAFCKPVEPVARRAVLLAESLATARAEGKALRDLNRALLDSLRRDSVVPVVVRKLRRAAPKWEPPPVALPTDSTALDSANSALAQCQETVREAARQIEGLAYSLDSANGETAQARFDAQTCAEELQKRPTSCNGWSAFGAGFVAGGLTVAAGCAVGD